MTSFDPDAFERFCDINGSKRYFKVRKGIIDGTLNFNVNYPLPALVVRDVSGVSMEVTNIDIGVEQAKNLIKVLESFVESESPKE